MRISDVMTTELPTLSPDDTLRDAAKAMKAAKVKALPVCDGERLTGIVTDWDVTLAVAEHDDAATMKLSACMTCDPIAIAPDVFLHEASELMGDHEIHHLLVQDGDRYAGMVHLDVAWSRMAAEAPMATFTAPI